MSEKNEVSPETVHTVKNQFSLFRSRNFAPLFVTQFLGAFNDNFYRSAMSILITYRLAEEAGLDARIVVTAAAGVFILPFVLFSAFAGQLADKYERSGLVRRVKLAEIVVMGGAVVAFYLGSIAMLMAILFLMGAQSAFFGPLKYSILPQLLDEDELIGANALIEMGTFLAILLGTIFGGLSVTGSGGIERVSLLVIGIAVLGWLASRYIPCTRTVNPSLAFRFNILAETVKIVNEVRPRRDIFPSVLGIAWFFLVGGTFLSQFPNYAKGIVGANEGVAMLFLGVFSVGTGLGSLACNSLLRGEVSGRYVPLAALCMSGASVLLYFMSLRPDLAPGVEPIGVLTFLSSPANVGILLSLLAISFSGGLYIVPLYAIIQSRSEEDRIATVTACVNVVDSLFMAVSSFLVALLLKVGLSIPGVFLVLAGCTVVVAYLIRGVAER